MIIEGKHAEVGQGIFVSDIQEGSNAEKSLAFQQAYGALRNRILAFTALPFTSLDRIALQKAVDDIAAADEGTPA